MSYNMFRLKYKRNLIEFVLRGELMEDKKNNIKNKIIIVVILIIILVFSSPLILNSLIIKSGINEYSNIAKEYVYDRYGLNYYIKSVEPTITYPVLADLMGVRVFFIDESQSIEFCVDVKNGKVVYDSFIYKD